MTSNTPRFKSGEQVWIVVLRPEGMLPELAKVMARFKVGSRDFYEYTIPQTGTTPLRLHDNEDCVPWRRIFKTRADAEGAIKEYLIKNPSRPVLLKPKYSIGDKFMRSTAGLEEKLETWEIHGILAQVNWTSGENPQIITNYVVSPVAERPVKMRVLLLEPAIASFIEKHPEGAELR